MKDAKKNTTNEIIKDVIKSTGISIGMAMTIFCFTGIVFDVAYSGNFQLENYRFTKMVMGSLITGLGFGVPTIIYRKDSLPMPIRVLIHMGTGCIVYTMAAYITGWLGSSPSVTQSILAALIQFGIAFLIWFLFMVYYRKEARKLNARIQEMK